MSNETQTVLDDLIASARDNGRYCAELPSMPQIVAENSYDVTTGRHFLIWLSTQLPERMWICMRHGEEIFHAWLAAFGQYLPSIPTE